MTSAHSTSDPDGPVTARTLRLPVGLAEQLREYAAQTRRSGNAAAVYLIERGLRAEAEAGDYTPRRASE